MSDYTTTTDLKSWLGSQVSSTAPGAYQQVMDRIDAVGGGDGVAQELLDQAEAEINSYFSAKSLAIPISTAESNVAAILRKLTLNIAAFTAWSTHPKVKEVPDRVQSGYDWAQEWLALYAAGDVFIPSSVALATTTASGARSEMGSFTPRFTESALEGF